MWTASGEVAITARDPAWIGATAHTNNTGELTAMHVALKRALGRPRGAGRETIHSDSLYTLHMTTGRWMPRCRRNRDIVGRLRRMWRQLQRQRPGEVTLRHVRSHVKDVGNEMADELATAGRYGGGMTTMRATAWLRAWIARHRAAGEGEVGGRVSRGVPNTLGDPTGEG